MKAILKSGSIWFTVFAAVLLLSGIVATIVLWGWLHPEESTTVSNSETLRNVGLLIGGGLAFVFAGWRAWVAERQTNASRHQSETAQLSLLNERYQRGAEMLGDGNLVVRMGGIGALKRLADQYPEHYHIQVMELFCAFVRHPIKDEASDVQGKLRGDLQAVMTAIATRGKLGLDIEVKVDYTLELRQADLSFARLSGANLSRANLSHAKLDHADFFDWPFIRPDCQATVL